MANICWKETPTVHTALLDDVPVCELKSKDIGGVTATWLNDRVWPAPIHMPKAAPQQTRFFHGMAEARSSVEQLLFS